MNEPATTTHDELTLTLPVSLDVFFSTDGAPTAVYLGGVDVRYALSAEQWDTIQSAIRERLQ